MGIKRPSTDISSSIRGQRPGGLGGEGPTSGSLSRQSPSMTIPGDGKTADAIGARHERSVAHYAGVLGRRVGGGNG